MRCEDARENSRAPFLSLEATRERCSTVKMSSTGIDDVTERLAATKVAPKNELSFKGKGWKLDKADDGKNL